MECEVWRRAANELELRSCAVASVRPSHLWRVGSADCLTAAFEEMAIGGASSSLSSESGSGIRGLGMVWIQEAAGNRSRCYGWLDVVTRRCL